MPSHLERDGPSKSHRSSLRKSIAHLPSPTYAGEDDKENLTADVGAITGMKRASTHYNGPSSKKSRSKSIGPGGLDTLQEAPKVQRKESSTGPPIKSILKPTVPLSPLREIPSHRAASISSKASGSGRASVSGTSKHAADDELLIDISVNEEAGRAPVSVSGAETLQNPFDVGLGVHDQGALELPISGINEDVHGPDDKEKERREKERKEILERREARRKSLANRRVSFAPEATLHTWNVVEFIQDSTTSSGSTNSTGRGSSLPAPAHAPAPGSDASEAPSTPPDQVERTSEQTSPADQRDGLRRKRRRRSSGAVSVTDTELNEGGPLSSPFSGSSAMESDDSYNEQVSDGDSANTGNESGEGDSTSMSLDEVEATAESLISAASSLASAASSGRLDEALRQAALHAGTRGIDYDENGDLSMEIANDQVTAAFEPWSKNRGIAGRAVEDLTSFQDQENQNPFLPSFYPSVGKDVSDSTALVEDEDEDDAEMDMTQPVGKIFHTSVSKDVSDVTALIEVEDEDDAEMDMTRPVGKILASQLHTETVHESTSGLRNTVVKQRPSLGPRLSSGEGSSIGDATMDLTMAIGGIQSEPDDLEPPPRPEAEVEPMYVSSDAQKIRDNEAEHPPAPPVQPTADMSDANGKVTSSSEVSMPPKILLQDFLKLTGIHFMDLTATKRKLHQLSRTSGNMEPEKDGLQENKVEHDESTQTHLEEYVKAAACTLPMLELYQHSCRELKRSLSEGRSIIRQIEANVYAENPGLFREYLSAPPDVRLIMDNQFKNLKAYARLSSKALWHDWRKQLLDDLKGGLRRIQDDMNADDMMLLKYEGLLSSLLPRLVEKHELLKQEQNRLQAQADEIARSNQEELGKARDHVRAIKEEIEEKRLLLELKRMQVREKQETIELAIENKMALTEEIQEAERIKEECRGWSTSEVRMQKDIADKLERDHGWTITSIKGTTITMAFQRELQLSYDISSLTKKIEHGQFQSSDKPIVRLSYLEDAHIRTPPAVRTIKDIFVQAMNKQVVHHMPRKAAEIPELLAFVRDSWRRAGMVAEEHRLLSLHFPTEVNRSQGDTAFSIKSSILLPGLSTKLQLVLDVSLFGEEQHQDSVKVSPRVVVVYGEQLIPSKMQEFLSRRVGSSYVSASEQHKERRWITAVRDLCGKLSGRGKDVSPVKR